MMMKEHELAQKSPGRNCRMHLCFYVSTVLLEYCQELIDLPLRTFPIFCGKSVSSHHMCPGILCPLQKIYECTASIPVASECFAVFLDSITAVTVHNYGNVSRYYGRYGSIFIVAIYKIICLPPVEYSPKNYGK